MPIGTPVSIGTGFIGVAGGNVTITVGAAGVPAGQTLFVDVCVRDTGGDATLTTGLPAVSDSVNGAYTQDILVQALGGNIKGARFRFSNNAALVQNDTITVSFANGATEGKAVTAYYVSGLDLTSPLDQSASANGSSATPSSGNITTTVADTIILGFLAGASAASDVTQDAALSSNVTSAENSESPTGGGEHALIYVGDRIVSAAETQAYNPTLSVSRAWAAGISAYRQAVSDHGRLIIGGLARGGTLTDTDTTQDASFVSIVDPAGTIAQGGDPNASATVGTRIISAVEVVDYNPTLSIARPWIAGISAYKADIDGGTSTPEPTITSSLTAETTEGAEFFYQIDATNGAFLYSASPLPTGLVADTDLGHITGTLGAGTADTYNINLGATNDSGVGNATLVLTVHPAQPAPPGGEYKRKCLPTAIVTTLGNVYATSSK